MIYYDFVWGACRMSYAELTVENPSWLKRFSHTRRFDFALALLAVNDTDDVLDYGTGDGFMLRKVLSANPQHVVGYEPIETQYKQLVDAIDKLDARNVSLINELGSIENRCFSKICCLEVLEHLTEENQRALLASIRKLLRAGGVVVISVPIEIGLSGLIKNIVRFLLGQLHPNTTLPNVLKSFLGWKIDRGDEDYISSHIGFDYRELEKTICASGFKIKEKRFSPFDRLGAFTNSQVFFVLESASDA